MGRVSVWHTGVRIKARSSGFKGSGLGQGLGLE